MEVKIEGEYIIIKAKINKPLKPSASGKTLIVFSSQGNISTSSQVDGKPVTIGLNCYVKP